MYEVEMKVLEPAWKPRSYLRKRRASVNHPPRIKKLDKLARLSDGCSRVQQVSSSDVSPQVEKQLCDRPRSERVVHDLFGI